jgi:hypothetical protein
MEESYVIRDSISGLRRHEILVVNEVLKMRWELCRMKSELLSANNVMSTEMMALVGQAGINLKTRDVSHILATARYEKARQNSNVSYRQRYCDRSDARCSRPCAA